MESYCNQMAVQFWKSVSEFLNAKLYLYVKREACYGCVHDRPSQRDHEVCLEYTYKTLVGYYLERVFKLFEEELRRKVAHDLNLSEEHITKVFEHHKFLKRCPFHLMEQMNQSQMIADQDQNLEDDWLVLYTLKRPTYKRQFGAVEDSE